jgi:hypothetical protein
MSGGVIGMVLVHGGVNGTVLVHAYAAAITPTPPAHVGTGVSTRGSLDIKAAKNLLGWGTSNAEIAHRPLLIMRFFAHHRSVCMIRSSRDLGWISQKAVAPFSIATLAREPVGAR